MELEMHMPTQRLDEPGAKKSKAGANRQAILLAACKKLESLHDSFAAALAVDVGAVPFIPDTPSGPSTSGGPGASSRPATTSDPLLSAMLFGPASKP